MFDTSASVQAAKTARAQTASAVAVVADPNPAGSYGTIPGFTGLHATASIHFLMRLSGEAVFVLEDAEVRLAPATGWWSTGSRTAGATTATSPRSWSAS